MVDQAQAGGRNLHYNAEVDRLTSHGAGCRCRVGEPDMLAETMCSLFAEKATAYTERNALVAALSKLWPSHLATHPADDAHWDPQWRTIICLHSPVGQLTWHVHDSERALFAHLLPGMSHWDGHTTDEKYARLSLLPMACTPPAVAASGPYVTDPGKPTPRETDVPLPFACDGQRHVFDPGAVTCACGTFDVTLAAGSPF